MIQVRFLRHTESISPMWVSLKTQPGRESCLPPAAPVQARERVGRTTLPSSFR